MLQFPKADVLGFQDQLKEIGATLKDGKFVAPDGTVPENQQMVIDLFHRCSLWSELVLER